MREDERYPKELEESSLLGNTVKLSAIIGTGAIAYRNRGQIRQAMKPVTDSTKEVVGTLSSAAIARVARSEKMRNAYDQTKSVMKAINYADDGRSVLSHLNNPSRFSDRFHQALQYSTEAKARMMKSKIGNEPLQIVEDMQKFRADSRRAKKQVFHSHRMEYVENELSKSMPEHVKAGLMGQLSQKGESWFDRVTLKSVKEFTDELVEEKGKKLNHSIDLSSDDKKKEFQDKVFETLEKYKSTQSSGFKENPQAQKRLLETTQKIRRSIYNGYLERNKPKDDFISKMMHEQGYTRATVEDLLEHKSGDMLSDFESFVARYDKGRLDGRASSKLKKAVKADYRVGDLVADPNLWIKQGGKTGAPEFLDARWMKTARDESLDSFRNTFQVPFLRFNPLDLLHFTTWDSIKNAPKTSFRRIGTIDPGLHGSVKEYDHPLAHNADAKVGVLARGYVNTADGKVFDLNTGELVKEDVYQASSRYGLVPRMMSGIGNLHEVDYRAGRGGVIGGLKKLFAVGEQESQHVFSKAASMLTKFDDYEWAPNTLNGLKRHVDTGGREGLSAESTYKIVYSRLKDSSIPLSDDAAAYVNRYAKDAYGDLDIDLTKLNTPDEIIGAFEKIALGIQDPKSGLYRDASAMSDSRVGLEQEILSSWNKFVKDPDDFLNTKRVKPDNSPVTPEFLSALELSDPQFVSSLEDTKRLIHMHALEQVRFSTASKDPVTVGSLIQNGLAEGALTKKDAKDLQNLETMTELRKYWTDVYSTNTERKIEALGEFQDRMLGDDWLAQNVQSSMENLSKWYSTGPGDKPYEYFGSTDTISMNKARGKHWIQEQMAELTKQGASPVEALYQAVGGGVKQVFANGKSPGDVTTASLPFYFFAERLDNSMAQIGLGLPQSKRGSAMQILTNQFGRRIVLPYVAYQQAVYLDGMFGDYFSDKAAETYANMHEDLGHIKEFFGLNEFGRAWERALPGFDQISENPLGRAFNFMTLGAFDNKSGEEIREFYESGEVAVRKGRYWGMGSNTPFTGGKVDRYIPNWYRRIKSDYKFTDTMYGSEEEYWANHWMPTITNPLAPVRHFFLDPYHYEQKHADDRPYAVTGGFASLQMVPIVGPALDNTVGRFLKPRKYHPDLEKAHREYIAEINANIQAQYAGSNEGGYFEGMPAGGMNLMQVSGGPSEEEAMAMEEMGLLPSVGSAGGAVRDQLALINTGYSVAGGPSLGMTGKSTRSLTALDDLRDPDVIAELADIGTRHDFNSVTHDMIYSASEMAGIYGFLGKAATDFDEGLPTVLQDSSRLASYQRAWWDLEMGGLGGNLSEIGRRYVPRDMNKNYWNPLKNNMPSWLPGVEYMTDFQRGDAYSKIANGEMRLPGEAYESLYKLHPDAFSEASGDGYGAFDRFRILADVAPYSDNYRFYRGVVSKMNQAGLLDEDMKKEYAEVRDQVSERKKKYRFYNRRFQEAELEYQTVTITKMIDATTFLTKENPYNPIRLAGVKVRSDDEETRAWLEQYIHEGAKIKIGVDADPLYRMRDDTYNTIRAVAYAGENPEGTVFPYMTKGQNINFMLANRKTGGFLGIGGEKTTSVHDDGSATATVALNSGEMITVGKIWEELTHDILPSLPVLGPVVDKFLQIRSPLEMYKRQEVFGRAWRPWEQPIEGWIKPMMDSISSQHPLVGAAQGAGIGWLFTKAGDKHTMQGNPKRMGARAGFLIGGLFSSARVFREEIDNLTPGARENWIPERRREEREINEYFDRLHYLKYRGLYEQAKKEALKREGVDIEALLEEQEERGQENKSSRRFLEGTKKWLSIGKKTNTGNQDFIDSKLSEIREQMKEIEMDRPSMALGKYSMLALRYKEEYESTLYGADPNGDMTKIFRALPSKDREFFTEFMKASPKEREEILRLVPEDQRRFYQAKWGLKVDEPESMEKYFSENYLPDENWAGWRPDVSLDNYKVKVIKREGLELTEFGLWGDDEKRAEESGVRALPESNISSMLDIGRLERVLRGAGLNDVSVSMTTTEGKGENQIQLAMDVTKDISQDIVREINNNLGGLFR